MKKIILSFLTVLAFGGCSQEELINESLSKNNKVRVVATLPNDDSRVVVEEVIDSRGRNYIKTRWHESGEFFVVMRAETGPVTTFQQTSEVNIFEGDLPTGGGPYYAWYDGYTFAIEGGGLSAKSMWCFIPNNGNLQSISPLLYAVSNDGREFNFKHLAAIVKFTLNGVEGEPYRLQISGLDDYKLVSQIDLTTDPPTFNSNEVVSDYIIDIDLTNLIKNSDGTYSFYLYFPPVNKNKFLNVEMRTIVNGTDYTYNANIAFQKDIESGKFYRAKRTLIEDKSKRKAINHIVYDYEGFLEWYNHACTNPFVNLTLAADIICTEAGENSRTGVVQDYRGIINGAGHSIKGLRKALIQSMMGGVMKDINFEIDFDLDNENGMNTSLIFDNCAQIESCNIEGAINDEANETTHYVGGLVSYNYGTITNCINEVTINSVNAIIGGIACYNYGKIIGCFNNAILNSTNSNVGGIAADNWGEIIACINKATISSSNNNTNGDSAYDAEGYPKGGSVGGIAGVNLNIIKGCINSAAISSTYGNIGGIVGDNFSSVSSCYSKGSVTCSNTANFGGIAGRSESFSEMFGVSGSLVDSYWNMNNVTQGVGKNFGQDESIQVTGDITWETAKTQMNVLLEQSGWIYVTNNGTDKDSFPLLLKKK